MTRILQLLSIVALLAALGLFSVLALSPPGTNLGWFANSPDDKFGHFIMFLLLGPLAAASFPKIRLGWLVLALLLFGAGIEFGQTFTGREASLEDLVANCLGLIAGVFPLAAYRLSFTLRGKARAGNVYEVGRDF